MELPEQGVWPGFCWEFPFVLISNSKSLKVSLHLQGPGAGSL